MLFFFFSERSKLTKGETMDSLVLGAAVGAFTVPKKLQKTFPTNPTSQTPLSLVLGRTRSFYSGNEMLWLQML